MLTPYAGFLKPLKKSTMDSALLCLLSPRQLPLLFVWESDMCAPQCLNDFLPSNFKSEIANRRVTTNLAKACIQQMAS
jgi:hypothetical protein